MSSMSYLSTIERYHEYSAAIGELLVSILTGIGNSRLFGDRVAQQRAMCDIAVHYPFVDLLYTLDIHGVQSSENIGCRGRVAATRTSGKGLDRSQRPYYQLARGSDGAIITDPYLSSASRNLCISAALKWTDADGRTVGYIVIDIDLAKTIEFLMGDEIRHRFLPVFKAIYAVIVAGLFCVVAVLLYSSFVEVASLFTGSDNKSDLHLKPFGVIIFLTLGLAVFDLGKTILEEEVLMHKDIFRHSSTRRTITRFIAAILIAVSIEGLLMLFKAALGDNNDFAPAIGMMLTAVGLLIGLGVYVYLGARAETVLVAQRVQSAGLGRAASGASSVTAVPVTRRPRPRAL